MFFGFFIIMVFIIIIVTCLSSGLFVVREQNVAIIERLGKYNRVARSGLNFKIPIIEKVATRLDLRVLQGDMEVENKTKDNVFVSMSIAVQYKVDNLNVFKAFYGLDEPSSQMASYIEDAIRAAVPKLSLDEVFEKKDEIALDIQETVAEEMKAYGYIIVKTLITSVEPAQIVRDSMNDINAAQRKRMAAKELAEAKKIEIVTAAEAEAEKARLNGRGIANQRAEIVNGLSESIQGLKKENSSLTESQIMGILLTNQYLDTLDNFAKNGNQVIFLPGGADGVNMMREQITSSIIAGRKIVKPPVHDDKNTK